MTKLSIKHVNSHYCYLMQIIKPLGKITMFGAKTFSTNTSDNQTVSKSIEYMNQSYN